MQPHLSNDNFNSVSDSLNQFQSNKSLAVEDQQQLLADQRHQEEMDRILDDQYLRELNKMPWMKKRKRGQSARNNLAGISFYGSKFNYKNQKKLKKETLLTQLQQSRKEIMIQRLELHNMRDQIEVFFRGFQRTQNKFIRKNKLNDSKNLNSGNLLSALDRMDKGAVNNRA